MAPKQALILGCGYTGRRVARRLLERGFAVTATSREPDSLAALERAGARALFLDVFDLPSLDALREAVAPGVLVLHSVPVLEGPGGPVDPTPRLLSALGRRPRRVVYLSTTSVYGALREVDEKTEPAPASENAWLRLAAEAAVAAGPWSWMVLRAAAIYGPGRGVHEALRKGRFRLAGAGENYVSRIHVEDLAEVVVAAMLSEHTGAWPVADAEPCPSVEIARFCADLLGLPLPPAAAPEELHETRRSDRRVDGSAVLRLLGVKLRYPSYRLGIPAVLEAEARGEGR